MNKPKESECHDWHDYKEEVMGKDYIEKAAKVIKEDYFMYDIEEVAEHIARDAINASGLLVEVELCKQNHKITRGLLNCRDKQNAHLKEQVADLRSALEGLVGDINAGAGEINLCEPGGMRKVSIHLLINAKQVLTQTEEK